MASRAPFSITSKSFNHTQGLNLKEHKTELLRHKNAFLLRKSFDLVLNDAIARCFPKSGATFVIAVKPDGTNNVKFTKDGRGFTVKGCIINPLHGRSQPFESAFEPVTITFSMPAQEEESATEE